MSSFLGSSSDTIERRMPVISYQCPYCGAPLDLPADSTIVLCLYCRHTTRIVAPDASQAGTTATLVKDDVAKEVVDQVIQMVLAGKRAEAIELYSRAAAVPPADAEKAINQISMLATLHLARNMPTTRLGIGVGLLQLAALGAGTAYAILRVTQGSTFYGVLALTLAVLFYLFLRMFLRRLRSTVVMLWGPEGRATVLRTAIVQADFAYGRTLVIMHVDVHPLDGSPPFEDDEPLLVRPQFVANLDAGNIIRVRFDRKRSLVFPVMPIEVVGHS